MLTLYIIVLTPSSNSKLIIDKINNNNEKFSSHYSYIAHAGGGINGETYTNSLEALQKSINNNYKLIELDLLVTSDKKLLAYHDWKSLSELCKIKESELQVLKISEIKKCKFSINNNDYTFLDGSKINKIFTENKNLILITDKIQDYKILKKEFKFQDRIFVETFGIANYILAKLYGIKNPMYNYTIGRRNIIYVKFFNIKLITTSTDNLVRYKSIFSNFIKDKKIIFSYSSNSKNFNLKHIGKTTSAVYTDFWNLKTKSCDQLNIDKSKCQKY
ncbi:glycerophosphodiester phosphodiesterase family protein [Alphaproteobacteria bacterium]|nr:glycerophosphodiester phosphodiesterase family protein [Alphaproteobacteria bacterium]MDB9825275.1 glycerophosphodiester phosphodiesterase family protein [Alphaproteobacteria bacterium]